MGSAVCLATKSSRSVLRRSGWMRKPHLAASACSLAGSFAAGAPGTAALKKCMRVASITKKRPRKVRSENADRNFLCDLEGKDSDLNIKDQVPCRAHPVFLWTGGHAASPKGYASSKNSTVLPWLRAYSISLRVLWPIKPPKSRIFVAYERIGNV